MEKIIGMLPNLTGGMLGQKAYNMIITDQRLIIAHFSNKLFKEELNKHTNKLKEEGVGRLKRMKEATFFLSTFNKRYFEMEPDAIMGENPDNYSIAPAQIKSVKFRQGTRMEDGRQNPNELIIKHANGKAAFKFANPTVKEAKTILSPLLGSFF